MAGFVSGISTLLDATSLEGCVRSEKELSPKSGTEYRASTDMSGGRHDAAPFAVGHVGADGNALIDVLRRIESPFPSADVVDEFAALCRDCCVSRVTDAQYAAALDADAWAVNPFFAVAAVSGGILGLREGGRDASVGPGGMVCGDCAASSVGSSLG